MRASNNNSSFKRICECALGRKFVWDSFINRGKKTISGDVVYLACFNTGFCHKVLQRSYSFWNDNSKEVFIINRQRMIKNMVIRSFEKDTKMSFTSCLLNASHVRL